MITEFDSIPNANPVATAIAAGTELAGPQRIGDEDLYVVHGDKVRIVDVAERMSKHLPRPARKTGTVHVHDAESFVEYLAKHGLPETEIWADEARTSLVAVINAHQEAVSHEDATTADQGAGHGDHRLLLELLTTKPWDAWIAGDRQWMDQVQFANHLEDNAADIIDPTAADMLDIAQTFQATTTGAFKSAQRLADGQVQLRYEEQVSARAGETEDLEIPTLFVVRVQPFVGAEYSELTARFRYRIRDGRLSLSYHLVRPEEVKRLAFVEYVQNVRDSVSQPMFAGRPA